MDTRRSSEKERFGRKMKWFYCTVKCTNRHFKIVRYKYYVM